MRKGVTPVVATIFLLAIAISSVVTASVFMNNSLNQVKDDFTSELSDQQKRDKSELTIEYAGKDSRGKIYIELRNTGTIPLPLYRSGRTTLSLYEEGVPVPNSNWSFSGSSRDVLRTSSKITLDTKIDFPSVSSYKKVEVRGPYGTDSQILCYNDGSSPAC
ncbi:MAG: archaellin/type IV pilin N-terminal domain-containing protein [Candidatus Nanohalobium sp.]